MMRRKKKAVLCFAGDLSMSVLNASSLITVPLAVLTVLVILAMVVGSACVLQCYSLCQFGHLLKCVRMKDSLILG